MSPLRGLCWPVGPKRTCPLPCRRPSQAIRFVDRLEASVAKSSLLTKVSSSELEVVVRHEQAHRRRRDALGALIAELLSRLHLPPIRRRLLADLHLASEQACDELAARDPGERLFVAETILRIVRLSAGRPPVRDTLLPTVIGSDIEERIDALLRHAPTPNGRPCLASLIGGSLLAGFACTFSDWLHHAVESALYMLIA